MRFQPSSKNQQEADQNARKRVRLIMRNMAIAFVIVVQLIIFFKMLY